MVAGTARQNRKLDQAARAAWLYYIAGNTQDEIALKLDVSRQAAQRLVALAVQEKLIKFRLDHPLAECLDLAHRLGQRFGLEVVEVVPADPAKEDPLPGLAVAAGAFLERQLGKRTPLVVGLATGRTLKAMVDEVAPMQRPDHRIVSLVGTMNREGETSPYDVAIRLADRIGARCFPMPTPVVAATAEERQLLQTQAAYRTVARLAASAAFHLVGIGHIGWGCPMHRDGFLTDSEATDLLDQGGVGEITGWAFDRHGRLVRSRIAERLSGMPLDSRPTTPRIAIAGGRFKHAAILAALQGGLLTGLITDQTTAARLLDPSPPTRAALDSGVMPVE
jgi:DNA-binding transcriptional regulator LsrR (DeoR family)